MQPHLDLPWLVILIFGPVSMDLKHTSYHHLSTLESAVSSLKMSQILNSVIIHPVIECCSCIKYRSVSYMFNCCFWTHIATIGIYSLMRLARGSGHLVNRERVLVEHKHLRRNRLLWVVVKPQELVVHVSAQKARDLLPFLERSLFNAASQRQKPSQLPREVTFQESSWVLLFQSRMES